MAPGGSDVGCGFFDFEGAATPERSSGPFRGTNALPCCAQSERIALAAAVPVFRPALSQCLWRHLAGTTIQALLIRLLQAPALTAIKIRPAANLSSMLNG